MGRPDFDLGFGNVAFGRHSLVSGRRDRIPIMRRSVSGIICAGVVLFPWLAVARTEWREGKLVNIDAATSTRKNGKPLPNRIFRFAVDAGDKVYEGEESGKTAPRVEVNSPVGYAIDKDHLYIKDAQGKTHKLALLKTTRKEAEPLR